jgi:hypothetical protein
MSYSGDERRVDHEAAALQLAHVARGDREDAASARKPGRAMQVDRKQDTVEIEELEGPDEAAVKTSHREALVAAVVHEQRVGVRLDHREAVEFAGPVTLPADRRPMHAVGREDPQLLAALVRDDEAAVVEQLDITDAEELRRAGIVDRAQLHDGLLAQLPDRRIARVRYDLDARAVDRRRADGVVGCGAGSGERHEGREQRDGRASRAGAASVAIGGSRQVRPM